MPTRLRKQVSGANSTTSSDKISAWIRRFHAASDPAIRLVCFPHAGGSASFYFPVSRSLAPSVEILAVQYPGRQDRRHERPLEKITELADEIHDALRAMGDARLAFFGHSMGATIAFEVARRCEQDAGEPPVALIASARRAPSLSAGTSVHLLDDEGIIAELKRLNGTNTALFSDDELLRTALPAIRSDYKAIESYTCPADTVLRCPITVLVGDSDPMTSVVQASAWRKHTAGDFELRIFPGGHFYVDGWRAPILDEIRQRLAPQG
jgi:surfactin synthase thioesterase subunit